MTTTELLERVKNVQVGDMFVDEAFEQGRLPETALREITKRYMRSQNYTEVFYKELLPDQKQLAQSREKLALLREPEMQLVEDVANTAETSLEESAIESRNSAAVAAATHELHARTGQESVSRHDDGDPDSRESDRMHANDRQRESAMKYASTAAGTHDGPGTTAEQGQPHQSSLPWENVKTNQNDNDVKRLLPPWIVIAVAASILATLLLLNAR